MEAVPRLPMISFELKTSSEPASFAPKLKQHIAEFYHEDPESYNNEFHALEGLRAAAVRPARDVTGCSILKRYYAQLHALQGRFPMERGQPMAITFSWRDVYTSSPWAVNDIKFEMAAILFNIGALHTQLGAADSRNSADGMKLACTHFQCAAWSFQHLRENFNQLPSEDMCYEVMGFMVSLSFAQAQECILEKSMADNRKATIVARIAVQVVDYYGMALAALMSGGDDAAVADTVGSKFYKEWKKYIQFKIAYCDCISLLYQGQQAEEQQKMGERVAFYQAAFNRLEEARKLAKGMKNSEAIAEALSFTNDVVEGKRKAARNENEFIYHEEVPEMSALTQATGAPLVKGIPFSVTDKDVLGEDIFKRLVPLSAHEASSIYSEEKAQLLRDVGSRVEAADVCLHSHLSSLYLQGLQPIEESIPQALIDRCAALSAQPDTTKEIVQAMDLLADTSSDVQSQLQEIQQLLEEEDAKEKSYQEKMGARPVNSVITELTREFGKYKEAHAKAGGSNETLRRAMSMHVNNLQVLGQPLSELRAAMPRLREEDILDESYRTKLQEILDKVEQMRSQRLMLYNQFRDAALADDITAKLVAWGDKPAEELFQKELQKHKDAVALLDQNLAAQDNILKALAETYALCAPFLKLQMDTIRKRENFCSSLVASYDAYEDLLAKISKGTDFYKKLHTNVSKLLARVKSVSNVQQEERTARLQTKTVPVKPENTSQQSKTSSTPKLKDYLAAGFGTDSYRVPGVRPRPLGSEGTTESPMDKTPNAFVNPYYQTLNTSNMNAVNQVYQSQTDLPGYTGMNYYPVDYGKLNTTGMNQYMGTQYNTDKMDSSIDYTNYYNNYAQYAPTSTGQQGVFTNMQQNNLPTNIAQQVSNLHQNTDTNIAQQGIISNSQQNLPRSINQQSAVLNIQQNLPTSVATNLPTNIAQQSALPNLHQNTDTNVAQQGMISNSQQNLPSVAQQSAFSNMQQNTRQTFSTSTIPQNVPSSVTNVVEPQIAHSYNMINNSSHQNIAANNVQLSVSGNSNQTSALNYAQQYQPIQNYDSKQMYQGYTQQNLGQNFDNTSQSYHSLQNAISSTDNMTQQMSNLSIQNVGAYNYNQQINQNDVYKNIPVTNLSQNPTNQQYNNSGADITHAISYSGHPGYSYNQNTGAYQYSSGYQNMQNYNNQPVADYGAPNYAQQQCPVQNLNPNEYWQQNYATGYQYTSAGTNAGTNDTLSSQTGYQGQSYAKQYASPTVPQTVATQYYTQQYGADVIASSAPISGYQMTPQSPMTYMNSSNNSTVTTYSQDQNALTTPTPVPAQSPSVQSNIDLLAGLDFSSSVPTLTPQQTPVIKTEPDQTKNLNSADIAQKDVSTKPTVNDKEKAKKEGQTEEAIEKKEEIECRLRTLQSPPSKEDLVRFLHEVERQEKYLDGVTTKTLNGPTPLETKWKELQDLLALEQISRSISVARCYPAKNRNPDFLPFDQTRVALHNTSDDYINASHIKDLPALCPTFIVTQTPVNNSVADFWSMVWEENVETVVCLLTEKELDLTYFPLQKDCPELFGDCKVILKITTEREYCTERVMSIKGHSDKPPRDFVHLQIRNPANNAETIAGMAAEIVASYQSQRSTSHPILIHCLTGAGLSGIFAYTICAVLTSKTGKPCLLDTLNVCCRLCSQRKGIFRERQDMLLAMEAELYNGQLVLNANNLMTSRQIQNKASSSIPPPQEVTPKDPFKDLDPMWQIRRKS